MKTKETSRELAIKWWKSKTLGEKLDLLAIHPVVGKAKERVLNLTGSEIEYIWESESNPLNNTELANQSADYLEGLNHGLKVAINIHEKSNQKQFKEFSPELFKAYINKFSEEDRLKAILILEASVDRHNLLKQRIEEYKKHNKK